MTGRRPPPPERPPPEYEVEIKHKVYIVSRDGLLKTPGHYADSHSYSPLDDEFESLDAAAEAILKDESQHNDEFVVLPFVRKRIKF